jgi:hypothetical protein
MVVFPPFPSRAFGRKLPPGMLRVSASNKSNPKKPAGQVGRGAAEPLVASNATSSIFLASDTVTSTTASVVRQYPVTADGDIIATQFDFSVTPTGNTATTGDMLTAVNEIGIYDSTGEIMKINPIPDIYDLVQRFSPQHVRPTPTTLNAANQVNFSVKLFGISLPVSGGPYTFYVTSNPASSVGTGTTSVTLSYAIRAVLGDAKRKSHFVPSQLPATPVANGILDLAPLAPIQDVDLTELFISGLTSNLADINYIDANSLGNIIATRVSSGALVAADNAQMLSPLPSTEIFPLLALDTNLALGRASHFYLNWGASPSSTIRFGYYWLE